jgi:flagellin
MTRISNTTEFNTQKLLNGGITKSGIGESTFQIGANASQSLSINIKAMDAKSLGVSRDVTTATVAGCRCSFCNCSSRSRFSFSKWLSQQL